MGSQDNEYPTAAWNSKPLKWCPTCQIYAPANEPCHAGVGEHTMGNIFMWDQTTKEIMESTGIAETVVGYADTQEEANSQIVAFREREEEDA